MKKALLIILLLFLTTKVSALSYSQWQETGIMDENKIVEFENRYRFYKIVQEGDYYPITTIAYDYPLIDYTNTRLTDYSTWQNTCSLDENYVVEEAVVYPYKQVQSIKYLLLTIDTSISDITSIEIYNNNTKVDHSTVECYNCNLDKQMTIMLHAYYYLPDLSLIVNSTTNTTVTISFARGSVVPTIFATSIIPTNQLHLVSKTTLKNPKYSSFLYSKEPVVNNGFYQIYPSALMCRQRNTLYFHYREVKEYYDDNYYLELDGYIKDEENFKTYYRYLLPEVKTTNEESIIDVNQADNNINLTEEVFTVDEVNWLEESQLLDCENERFLEVTSIESEELFVPEEEKEVKIKDNDTTSSLIPALKIEKGNTNIIYILAIILIIIVIASIITIICRKNRYK
ncbi:MAG: hypothetical protein Q4G04_01595 [bacterium]|nr:hypothetical protein [bacterium]